MTPVSRRDRSWRRLVVCVVAALAFASGSAAAQDVVREELTIYVNEITTWSPGYPMGDVVLGASALAGYEPTAQRRELMLRGKQVGRTTLSVWDQRRNLRHELTLVVSSRTAEKAEADLLALLAPYPDVALRRLGGQSVLTGTVATAADLKAVNELAKLAGVRSVVTSAAPAVVTGPVSAGGGAPAVAGTGGVAPGGAAARVRVEYQLELFEASTQFRTGEYGKGVEPSGRSLYKSTVTAILGEDETHFIGGSDLDPKTAKQAASQDVQTGIKLTLSPRPAERGNGVTTGVLVETNIPLEYDLYDPDVWRRSRFTFGTTRNIPFGLSGNDLLAAPSVDARGNPVATAGRTTGRTARQVSSLPGPQRRTLSYVPVFGSLFGSNSYKQKRTQLLVVLTPVAIDAEPQG